MSNINFWFREHIYTTIDTQRKCIDRLHSNNKWTKRLKEHVFFNLHTYACVFVCAATSDTVEHIALRQMNIKRIEIIKKLDLLRGIIGTCMFETILEILFNFFLSLSFHISLPPFSFAWAAILYAEHHIKINENIIELKKNCTSPHAIDWGT